MTEQNRTEQNRTEQNRTEQPKRVLVIHPALVVGGAEIVLLNYLEDWAKNPHYQFDVIFMENRENFNFHRIPENVNVKFLLSNVESELLVQCDLHLYSEHKEYWNTLKNIIWDQVNNLIIEHINHTWYDAIIDFHHHHTSFENFMGKFDIHNRIKLIKWFHGMFFKTQLEINPHDQPIIFNKYDLLVTVSEDMKTLLSNELSKVNLKKEIAALYNPSRLNELYEKSYQQLSEIDEQLMKSSYIVQVARLSEGEKNHLQMIEIYSELKKKGIKEKLYIIGEGQDRQILENKIQNLELTNDVLLLGHRDNPLPFMRNAKLFIHTSHNEGLPTVFIESMISGTPVVSMDCPTGPREILADGKYGVLVPLYDKETFVNKTYELLTDENKRQHYVDLLPEAVQRFSNEIINKKFFEILDKLTSQ